MPRPPVDRAQESEAAPAVFDVLAGQPEVRSFLVSAVREGRLSHAYLFIGAPGSGMLEAAQAVAQVVVCPHGGDGSCDECIRVSHHTHPDVRWLSPASATGYLISQVRELVDEVALAPVRASGKVYILDNAGLLRGAAANALLKTIEEPPEGVMFILIARSAASVMPTIVSRCQQVPFRIVDPNAAAREVELRSGIGGWQARVALAVAATPERAASFLASPERRETRRLVIRSLGGLARDDSWDILGAARSICASVRAPLADVKKQQEAELDISADYLGRGALKQLEDANKRELSARERSGMMEALSAADSLLRDVLLRCEGAQEAIVNEDAADVVDRIAQASTTEGVTRALEAVARAADDLAHNVVPQLTLEVMLLSIKEAL